MSFVNVNWKPSVKECRRFGVSMVILCSIVGAVLYFKGLPKASYGAVVFGFICFVLGFLGRSAVLPIYWLWMSIAFVVAKVLSPVICAVLFYVIMTPWGYLMRACGRDRLSLKRKPQASFWVDTYTITDNSRFVKQF